MKPAMSGEDRHLLTFIVGILTGAAIMTMALPPRVDVNLPYYCEEIEE